MSPHRARPATSSPQPDQIAISVMMDATHQRAASQDARRNDGSAIPVMNRTG